MKNEVEIGDNVAIVLTFGILTLGAGWLVKNTLDVLTSPPPAQETAITLLQEQREGRSRSQSQVTAVATLSVNAGSC